MVRMMSIWLTLHISVLEFQDWRVLKQRARLTMQSHSLNSLKTCYFVMAAKLIGKMRIWLPIRSTRMLLWWCQSGCLVSGSSSQARLSMLTHSSHTSTWFSLSFPLCGSLYLIGSTIRKLSWKIRSFIDRAWRTFSSIELLFGGGSSMPLGKVLQCSYYLTTRSMADLMAFSKWVNSQLWAM